MADEIINCEKVNTQASYALKKKEEIEKVAKGNRWFVLLSYLHSFWNSQHLLNWWMLKLLII